MVDVAPRACGFALLCVLSGVTAAHAQTMEVFAGGRFIVDAPATSVQVSPQSIVVAPTGHVYVADYGGRLLRFTPWSGTVTVLSGLPNTANVNLGTPYGLTFTPTGDLLFARSASLHRLNLETFAIDDLGGIEEAGRLVYGADGALYYTSQQEHVLRARLPSGQRVIVAGTGEPGFGGDGGPAQFALLSWPSDVAADPAGNIYVADNQNSRIRKVDIATGIISTVAGTGEWQYNGDGLSALQTNIGYPQAVAFDAAGNLYISAEGRIVRLDAATGTFVTVAGTGVHGFSGDGGPAVAAQIQSADALAIDDANGDLYFAAYPYRIRKVAGDTGLISTAVGNGEYVFCGEAVPARAACLATVRALDVDAADNLLIPDFQRLRQVSAADGLIRTVSRPPYQSMMGAAYDAAGNMYYATFDDNRIYRVDAVTGLRTAVAGKGSYMQSWGGDGGPATAAGLAAPIDVAFDNAGNLYFSDAGNNRIRRVAAATGIITTYAGGSPNLGDGGLATQASLISPTSIEFDAAGNLFIVDSGHCRLRKVDAATGIISTVAGNGNCVTGLPNGPATALPIDRGATFTLDPAGNVFIAWSNVLSRINAATGIISTITPTLAGTLRTPEALSLQGAGGMTFDSLGRLYVSDQLKYMVFRISGLPYEVPDTTAPVIEIDVAGAVGENGWYRSDVQLAFAVSDDESSVSATSGCTASSVTSDTAGITFTCTATSSGGTATRAVTIKRDTVAPQLEFGAAAPQPDAQGYHTTDVDFAFETSDAVSGVYSTSSPSPLTIVGEGMHLTRQVVVTDFAGNSATFTTPEVFIERSPPVIEPQVAGTTFADGWYVGDVLVTWTVTDGQSPLSSTSGCGPTSLTEDTAGVTFTCTATSLGGTASASVVVKRDATPPTVTFGGPSPAPDANGWHTGAVSIPFTVADALSGVEYSEATSPLVIDEEGAGIVRTFAVRDAARNSLTVQTPPVNIDLSAPTIQSVVTGAVGNNGWYTSDVQVSWTIGESTAHIITSDGCATTVVSSDTAGATFTCTVTSGGGTAVSSVTVKRDATAPVLTWGSATPLPNAAGWNKANVKFPFTRSDALSGLASTSAVSPLTVSEEGTGVFGTVTVTDLAGNVGVFTTPPRNIDKTVPTIELGSPVAGTVYGFYSNVRAEYSCADTISGTASCTAPVADGALLNTKTLNGSYSFKVTARDVAGNTATRTHAWSVAGGFNFEGFLAPANGPPVLNQVARGTRVPIRWRLPDGNGGFVTNTSSYQSITVTNYNCSGDSVPFGETTTGPVGISFNAADNTFTYNWNTGTNLASCRSVVIRLRDGVSHEILFTIH
jgi:sugar lactone lactonase YvrE